MKEISDLIQTKQSARGITGYGCFLLVAGLLITPISCTVLASRETISRFTQVDKTNDNTGIAWTVLVGPKGKTLDRVPTFLEGALDGIDLEDQNWYRGQWEIGDPQKIAMLISAGPVEFDVLALRGTQTDDAETPKKSFERFKKN